MIKVIGLTGPIGSGKNEVAKVLKRRGAYIIDADQIGHSLLVPQTDVWRKIVQAFGIKILRTGGDINRSKLGEMVFKDPAQMEKLNQIMHPPMVELITAEIEKAKQEGYKLIVVNAAVLQKMGLVPVVDEVWAVIAPLLLRVKRLLKKGYSNEEIYCRAGTQPKDSGYKTVADEIILNNGTLKQLRQKTLSLLSAS